MKTFHPLQKLVARQKKGIPTGICSACSTNRFVLEACLEKGLRQGKAVLIESTSNQVNQFGGYTGWNPANFKAQVRSVAKQFWFPVENLILGGDHLGPNPWQNEGAESAMKKACDMVRAYVLAGFTKIHLDASMYLGDDSRAKKLSPRTIAERQAQLCASASDAYLELREADPGAPPPVYVIGSEVPIPGGATEPEDALKVTRVSDFHETVRLAREAFFNQGLKEAWNHVIAVVVQPGVEFGDDSIHAYNRKKARALTQSLKEYEHLVFEGHSTDYQTHAKLSEMIEDGISILKVGPALTFAAREALFLLNQIEIELFRGRPGVKLSRFVETLELAMRSNPVHWKKHYHGDERRQAFARKFSFSDRCRYYLNDKRVAASLEALLTNLGRDDIPLALLSQYMPDQYRKVREDCLKNRPQELIKDKVLSVLTDYDYSPVSKLWKSDLSLQ